MNSIWRHRICQRLTAVARHQLAASGRRWCLLPGLIGVVVLPGCAWVRAQAQHRSNECQQLCNQAEAAQESGRPDRADRLLDEALRKSPRDLEVQRQLAESLWQAGRQKDALTEMTRLAEAHPQDVRLAVTMAEWLSDLERYDEALEWLNPGLAADPELTALLELKAEIELAQGNDAAALMTYQRLGRQEASQADALIQMGRIHMRHGQPERAAPLFRSVQSHPRANASQKSAARWELGVAYAQLQRWSDASVELANASRAREMSADDWHALAYAQFQSDEWAAAKASINHALALEPRHPAGQTLETILIQAAPQDGNAVRLLSPVSFERAQESIRRSVR